MLPRLEASEQLARINGAALAAGGGEPLDRQRIFAALEAKASGQGQAKPERASPADLAGMGIGLTTEGGDLPTIGNLDAWLGNGEQERG